MIIRDIAAQMEYPGRFLILKHLGESMLALYGVTARNPASKAKRYVYDESIRKAFVIPTDAETMARGDLTLLDYTALHLSDSGLVLGNGRQTDAVESLTKLIATEQLETCLQDMLYEHDKYATPRITACVIERDGTLSAALHHIYRGDADIAVRHAYDIPSDGHGYFLSTYAGPNVRPTPSYTDNPIPIDLPEGTIESVVGTVFDAFAPVVGNEDLRVSVVGVQYNVGGESTVYIHNAI